MSASETASISGAASSEAVAHHGPLARVRRAVRDSLILTRRNLTHFVRQPQLLIFSTIQPVMFVLLFAFVFGGAIGAALPPGVEYVNFLLPGIFVQSVAFRATQTAVGLAEDLEKGVVDRLRSMPTARLAMLAGRTAADLVRNVVIIAIMVAVGYAIGFRFEQGPLAAVASVLVVALFGFALSWIFAYVGLSVRGAEAAQSAGFVAIFPLVFASSIFVPIETMPGWLQGFAAVSPITVTADAARSLAIGGPLLEPLVWTLIWSAGIVAVFAPLSVRRFRRMG